jgi:hypothetical protein
MEPVSVQNDYLLNLPRPTGAINQEKGEFQSGFSL